MVVSFLARIPVTAIGMALTFHVLGYLDGSYAEAGLVGAAATIAIALGAPFMGRLTDRRGLRTSVAVGTITAALFWSSIHFLSYPALLLAAFLGGLASVPVWSVTRQALAAVVPPDQRRAAFTVDSMSTEFSYMIGPALAVLLATQVSPRVSVTVIGAGTVLAGLALYALNPATNENAEAAATDTNENADASATPTLPAPPRRTWMRAGFVSLLLVSAAALMTVAGGEMALVAALRQSGQESMLSIVIVLWCAYSVIGGFVYGGLSRGVSSVWLGAGMAALLVPVGLFGGASWWVLALALIPTGLLCAPVLASNTDELSRLVPAEARGEALGIQGSAMTVGIAVGAPLAGWVSDTMGPAWGFAVVGVVASALIVLAVPLWFMGRRAESQRAAQATVLESTAGVNG